MLPDKRNISAVFLHNNNFNKSALYTFELITGFRVEVRLIAINYKARLVLILKHRLYWASIGVFWYDVFKHFVQLHQELLFRVREVRSATVFHLLHW